MDIWGILGILPTKSTAEIKKAYAGQLKKHHPEDDPEGFQQLREAYENALRISNGMKHLPSGAWNPGAATLAIPDDNDVDPARDGNEPLLPPLTKLQPNQSGVPEQGNHQDEKELFLQQVRQLYADFFSRIELKNWKALFDCDLLWNVKSWNEISNELLVFLGGHPNLPPEVWEFIDGYFHWNEQIGSYDSQVFVPLVNYLTDRITSPSRPDYFCLKPIEDFDYERFLESREIALHSTLEEFLGEAAQYYFTQVEMVYPDDPQLAAFLGQYYYKTKDHYQAKSYLEEAIRIAPKDYFLLDLLEKVNQAIRINLGFSLIKKPFRKDAVKQYYRIVRDLQRLKRASLRPATLPNRKIILVVCGSFIVFGLMARFTSEFRASLKNSPAFLKPDTYTPIPMEITERNMDQLSPRQTVKVRFDSITCLELMSTGTDRVFTNYPPNLSLSEKQRLNPTRVVIGKLNQKEIILVENPILLSQKYPSDSLNITGTIYDLVSPRMLETVKTELTRMNASDQVAANLVTTKYIVVDDYYQQR